MNCGKGRVARQWRGVRFVWYSKMCMSASFSRRRATICVAPDAAARWRGEKPSTLWLFGSAPRPCKTGGPDHCGLGSRLPRDSQQRGVGRWARERVGECCLWCHNIHRQKHRLGLQKGAAAHQEQLRRDSVPSCGSGVQRCDAVCTGQVHWHLPRLQLEQFFHQSRLVLLQRLYEKFNAL